MGLEGFAKVGILRAFPTSKIDTAGPYGVPELVDHNGQVDGLNRAASYTALAALSKDTPVEGLKRTFSDNVLNSPTRNPTKVSPSMQNANVELFRRASRKAKKRMSVASVSKEVNGEQDTDANKENAELEDRSRAQTKSVGGTLKNFARRSWMSTSRTTSPTRKDDLVLEKKRSRSPKKPPAILVMPKLPEPVASRVPSRSSPPLEEGSDEFISTRRSDTSPAPPKVRSLRDIQSRNLSVTSLNRLSRQSSMNSLRSRGSADGMYLEIPATHLPPLPTSISSDRLSGVSVEVHRKKDPLWTAFRNIEGEWSSFQSKTSLQKAKVIRTALLPFLSKHADEPSQQQLRTEDLDRRIVILNKWWTGLLELLNGRSNQSISGTDRPAFLEAIIEIMLRREWRVPPFQNRLTTQSAKGTAASVESDESEFLLESIYQNIRNTFVQNLLSQMAFVVDKLSMRSAPASLVTFGGKTCAYAFFYCPGVADVLVRLWHIPAGIIRRIFSEHCALHNSTNGTKSTELGHSFPQPVRSLCFSSQSGLARHVQPRAQRPTGSESIRWYGPWVNRWIGRDSDLFFVFVKHYHLLVCDFHPLMLSREERVCIPGFAPVHAQLLIVLESTLYRHVGHFSVDAYTIGDSPDAMAPLPMTVPNATRSITENRLVILMRDITYDPITAHENVCTLLVESFELIMKAATRKVSMYNNDASFVLCDLVEEMFPILTRYEHLHQPNTIIDWAFWMGVFQQMVQSETCLTQIRVIALLYSMWPNLVSNEDRKRQLVLDWLLRPAFFAQLFNHWSPMVRHYYYRLLCWRVGRCDGEATELDVEILQTLARRLNTAWAHHQYLVAEADMREMSPPSTNPCSPAPGRTLIIIRTDSQPASPSPFTTFDKLLSSNPDSPYSSHSSVMNPNIEADTPAASSKKRWSILKTMNPFSSSPSNGRPGEVTPPSSPENSVTKRGGNSGANSAAPSRPGTPPHQALSFKFSLEYVNNSRPQMPSKNKKLPLPMLPPNAQKKLDALSALERLSSDNLAPKEIKPLKPKDRELNSARYSGRALSEWAQIVAECRNFYLRRKQEGCPKDALVETPTMAAESFRMFG